MIYIPAVFLFALAVLFLPALATVKFRFFFSFGICAALKHWAHRAEEWYNAKPLLVIMQSGLAYEDGGKRVVHDLSAITGIALQRRIAPWLTNGHMSINPRYWLTLRVRNPHFGEVRKSSFFKSDEPEFLFIDVWPREVEGGLLRLRRFAESLKLAIESQLQTSPENNLGATQTNETISSVLPSPNLPNV